MWTMWFVGDAFKICRNTGRVISVQCHTRLTLENGIEKLKQSETFLTFSCGKESETLTHLEEILDSFWVFLSMQLQHEEMFKPPRSSEFCYFTFIQRQRSFIDHFILFWLVLFQMNSIVLLLLLLRSLFFAHSFTVCQKKCAKKKFFQKDK